MKKLMEREFAFTALVVALVLMNHFLGWGMTLETILGLIGASGAFAVSRGIAKATNGKE